jgi:hypothetical protein
MCGPAVMPMNPTSGGGAVSLPATSSIGLVYRPVDGGSTSVAVRALRVKPSHCLAAPATQVFILMGTLVLLPIILGYMIFVYWIFRGKLREGEGYH